MNEPIMRRGLSPEGRKIRQRHQGSLLNDEFGVTSRPIHKKIEKDFLKENVMRLKEIQAKCRGQESRPNSGCHPVKAVRSSLSDVSIIHHKDPLMIEDGVSNEDRLNLKLKLREGSAHSDYFSLPDGSSNETLHTPCPSDIESVRDVESRSLRKRFVDIIPNCSGKQKVLGNETIPIPKKLSSNLEEEKFISQNDLKYGSNHIDFQIKDKVNNYPHSSHFSRSKVNNIIENIKSKPPACETNIEFIWRDIKKEHKALFMNEVCPSVNTFGTLNLARPNQNNNLIKSSKVSSIQNNSSALVRSKSLDRNSQLNKNNKLSNIYSSTFSLESRPSSSKSVIKLVDLEPNVQFQKCKETVKKDSSAIHSESLPNLADKSEANSHFQSTNLGLNNTEYQLPSEKSLIPLYTNQNEVHTTSNDNFHIKDRPSNTDIKNYADPSRSDKNENFTSEINEDMSEKQITPPIINKKIYLNQKLKSEGQRQFLRSKSSTNLHISGEPPLTYKRGQIPRYLKTRKAEAQRRLEAAAAVDPMCPPGHTPISDHERKNTLHLLKKGQMDVIKQLSSLPLGQDTLRVRQLKRDLEAKLNQIDEGIEIFSQPKVYVINED